MSLEDRIRSTVDQAVAPLIQQLLAEAAAERDEVVRAAKVQILDEAEQAARSRVADAEAHLQASMEAKAADDLRSAVAAARVKEREIETAGVSRLLDRVRGLDGATSLSEVLDALALGAAREAARAAVVVLRNDRIQGWRMSGFGTRDSQPKSIDLALADSGVIGLAVGAARAVTTRDGQSSGAGPGFETLSPDEMGLAVPVVVGGRVVAIVYADAVAVDGHERQLPNSWPELIEVLARHAGRCLEALASQKAAPKVQPPSSAGASATSVSVGGSTTVPPATSAMTQITDGVAAAARRTARLLVSDIRLFHEPAVSEGRRHRNILVRLAPEIEKARQAYNEQVPAGVRDHTDYFHQELIKTLAGGDASLLGNLA
jgi:hypothetical protein